MSLSIDRPVVEPKWLARVSARVMRIEGMLGKLTPEQRDRVLAAVYVIAEESYGEGKAMLNAACTALHALRNRERFGSVAASFSAGALEAMANHAAEDQERVLDTSPEWICSICSAPFSPGNDRWRHKPDHHLCVGAEKPKGRKVRFPGEVSDA